MTQTLGRRTALLFHDRGTKRYSGQQHSLAAIYPLERIGTHTRGGLVGVRVGLEGDKICEIGIRSRTFQAGVPQSLYRLSYAGPHQSLILLFNSRITPCAHSATSCRQNLRRNSPLRTAKTHSNSLDPIAQLKAKHDIHTCAVICQYVQWSGAKVVFERHNTCGTRGKISGKRGVDSVILVTFKVISAA